MLLFFYKRQQFLNFLIKEIPHQRTFSLILIGKHVYTQYKLV